VAPKNTEVKHPIEEENGAPIGEPAETYEGPADPRTAITYLTIARMGCNPELVKLPKEMRLQLNLPPEGSDHLLPGLWRADRPHRYQTFDRSAERRKPGKLGFGWDHRGG
jgi:hypothetical protein